MHIASIPGPLLLTLQVASLATLIAALAGTLLAYLVSRRQFWGREFLDACCTLPLVLPPTVLGYYLIVVWGRNGWLGHWLQEVWGISLMFTWQGAVLAAALVSFPLVYKSARAAFEDVDHTQENVARTLGLSEGAVFRRVSLPLALAGDSGRDHAGLCPGHGRIRRHPHDRRQSPRQDPDPVPGDL